MSGFSSDEEDSNIGVTGSEGSDGEVHAEAVDPQSAEGFFREKLEENAASEASIPFVSILNQLAQDSEPLRDFISTCAEEYRETKESGRNHRRKLVYVAAGMATIFVAGAGFLTYLDKMPGSTFAFMLGLVIGYMLTFMQNVTGPTSPDKY